LKKDEPVGAAQDHENEHWRACMYMYVVESYWYIIIIIIDVNWGRRRKGQT